MVSVNMKSATINVVFMAISQMKTTLWVMLTYET